MKICRRLKWMVPNGNQLASCNDQCVWQLLDHKLMYLLLLFLLRFYFLARSSNWLLGVLTLFPKCICYTGIALGGQYCTYFRALLLEEWSVWPAGSKSEHRSCPIFTIREETECPPPSKTERCEVKFGEKISTPAFSSNSSWDTFCGFSPSLVGFFIKYFSPLFGSTN